MLLRVIFGPLREPDSHADHATAHAAAGHDVPNATVRPVAWHEIAGLAPIMFLIVAVGVYPRPILEQIQPAVRLISQNVRTQRERSRESALPPATKGPRRRAPATSNSAPTGKAPTGKAATGKAATGKAATGKAATGKAATGKAADSKAADSKADTGKAADSKASPSGKASQKGE